MEVTTRVKICGRCKQGKIESDFYKAARAKDGLQSICVECKSLLQKSSLSKTYFHNRYLERAGVVKARSRAWKRGHPEKVRASYRKILYGVSKEEFQTLRDSQNNGCSICKNPFIKTPHIDHDHSTGKIRGLLCGNCNRGLGIFHDSIEKLSVAITYLKKHL